MAAYLDAVPLSGIIRIRDMMYGIQNPYRLDQGDLSFDAPETVKGAMSRAIAANHTHYLQTTGLPRLRELIARKLRDRNHVPVEDPEHVLVTNGGIHGLYIICQALLEPGDEVILPDPEWPPAVGNVLAAKGVPVRCPLYESHSWRYDLAELESKITPRTRIIYLNSPHNPTGGVLPRADLEAVAAMARERKLWVISDEAYEDVIFEGEHVSIGSLPGMAERTISLYTFSKSYAMTGLRLGYFVVSDPLIRERARKVLFYTTSNVSSIVQFGGIGALEGSQEWVERFRVELGARRDLFYDGIHELEGAVFSGKPPAGAFYAFLRIDPAWARDFAAGTSTGSPAGLNSQAGQADSISWRMTEHLISKGRIGCVPGVDFGEKGEGYVRFCFARDRAELTGALASMKALFGVVGSHA